MNNEERKDKPLPKSTIITPDALYEMVFSPIDNKSTYVKMDRGGQMETALTEVEIEGQKYVPFPSTYTLVDKKVILFPSLAAPYENEEEILNEIRTFIHKYLEISEVFEQIATYYVLFTWMYDRFNEVPYLRAIGDFGSGKSRFLQAIGYLCYKPVLTSGATSSAPIFRILSEIRGTLVMDEADFKFSDMTSEMIKILNSGYQKGTSVIRCKPNTFDPEAFDVYGPKIIATRETFTDKALESRFLVEEMGSVKLRTDIPRTLDESFYTESEAIRNKLLMWRLKNYFSPIARRTEVIEGIHPRLNQIVIPLMSIIKDDVIRDHLKSFIIQYNNDLVADRGQSWESEIIFSILKLEQQGIHELTVGKITEEVNREIDVEDETLQPRKVGWYLRKKLQLKLERLRNGWTLSTKLNRKKLDMWKERFGITDAYIRGEQVNDVNDVNVPEEITPEEIPF